tara:strand:+ start:446 stop:598 length:153 start_codon:yes stop_codon:yes gene_type:complete
MNMLGQEVASYSFGGEVSVSSIDFSTYPPSTYFVKIMSHDVSHVLKIVLQ